MFLTPTKPVPHEWFGKISGKKILGLASGGGQQMPIFAALGADCTVMDYSEEQLKSERIVAEREGYSIRIIRGDMTKPLPFEIEGIVLIDAAGIKAGQTPAQKRSVRRFKRLKKFFAIPAVHWFAHDVIDEWLKNQGSADYRNASPIMKKAMVMAISEDLSDLLPNIKEDTLLIWGENDTATPLKDGKKMEALIPDSGLCVIENAGHFSFAEQPAVFKSIMANYFPAGSAENSLK